MDREVPNQPWSTVAVMETNPDGPASAASSEQAIVIAGTAEDWPDNRVLTPRKASPNGTLWFGAELDPEGHQVLVPDRGVSTVVEN